MLSYLESYPNIKLRDNHREICYIKLNTIKHTILKINVHNTLQTFIYFYSSYNKYKPTNYLLYSYTFFSKGLLKAHITIL